MTERFVFIDVFWRRYMLLPLLSGLCAYGYAGSFRKPPMVFQKDKPDECATGLFCYITAILKWVRGLDKKQLGRTISLVPNVTHALVMPAIATALPVEFQRDVVGAGADRRSSEKGHEPVGHATKR